MNEPLFNTSEMPQKDVDQLLFTAKNSARCFEEWAMPNSSKIESQTDFELKPIFEKANQLLKALKQITDNPDFLKDKDGKSFATIFNGAPLCIYKRAAAELIISDEIANLQLTFSNSKIAYLYENGSDENQFPNAKALNEPFGYDDRSTYFRIEDGTTQTITTINLCALDPNDENALYELGQTNNLESNTVYIGGGISFENEDLDDKDSFKEFNVEVPMSNYL